MEGPAFPRRRNESAAAAARFREIDPIGPYLASLIAIVRVRACTLAPATRAPPSHARWLPPWPVTEHRQYSYCTRYCTRSRPLASSLSASLAHHSPRTLVCPPKILKNIKNTLASPAPHMRLRAHTHTQTHALSPPHTPSFPNHLRLQAALILSPQPPALRFACVSVQPRHSRIDRPSRRRHSQSARVLLASARAADARWRWRWR